MRPTGAVVGASKSLFRHLAGAVAAGQPFLVIGLPRRLPYRLLAARVRRQPGRHRMGEARRPHGRSGRGGGPRRAGSAGRSGTGLLQLEDRARPAPKFRSSAFGFLSRCGTTSMPFLPIADGAHATPRLPFVPLSGDRFTFPLRGLVRSSARRPPAGTRRSGIRHRPRRERGPRWRRPPACSTAPAGRCS